MVNKTVSFILTPPHQKEKKSANQGKFLVITFAFQIEIATVTLNQRTSSCEPCQEKTCQNFTLNRRHDDDGNVLKCKKVLCGFEWTDVVCRCLLSLAMFSVDQCGDYNYVKLVM